jgi:hypothetical protein
MYYAMSNPLIVGKQTPEFVPYLRYTGFLVLYPIGFLSEFAILLKAFGAAQGSSYSIFVLPLGVLLLGYWPGTSNFPAIHPFLCSDRSVGVFSFSPSCCLHV